MIDFLYEMWNLLLAGEVKGIVFWIAIYAVLVCGYSVIFQVRTRFYKEARGRLLEFGVDKAGATTRLLSDQNYLSKALYSYEIDGVSYQGKRVSPWVMMASHNAKFVLDKQLSSINVGDDGEVAVFYYPKNPEKSYLKRAGIVGIVITALLGLLPAIFFVFYM